MIRHPVAIKQMVLGIEVPCCFRTTASEKLPRPQDLHTPPYPMLKSSMFTLACFVLGAACQAQTLTSSSQYGIPIIQSVTEIDETGFLAFFDSNLGTLTAITLNLYGAGITEISITNNAATTINAMVTGSSNLYFSSGYAPLDVFLQNNDPVVELQFPIGSQTFVPGQTSSFGPLAASGSKTYDLASLISQMQTPGGGNFSINAQSLNGLTVLGGGGNLFTSQSTTAGSGASIVYSYVAIPEPSCAILMAFALVMPLTRRCRA